MRANALVVTMRLRALPLLLAIWAALIPVISAQRAGPSATAACFVRNCQTCNARNSYLCTRCNAGYVLTASLNCNSCAAGYEQNLDERTFVCSKCPPGFTSPGGTGEASQCQPDPPTASRGRRLFESEDDVWA